jgi:pilus assembly protein CpaF
MANNPVSYLESSFLSPLLSQKEVTDISYNGRELYYLSNRNGRQKALKSPNLKQVGDFLRQIANLSEKQFSYTSPILDVSFGRYRLNAVFSSLSRKANEKTYSFSLRLASKECRIEEDPNFFEGKSKEILLSLLRQGESVLIGGLTGSGKTELQKWCLLHFPPSERVIVIDNVEELDLMENPALDLTTWLVNDRLEDASFASLIRNALRNNPDYIVIAEARGKEMLDAIVSSLSGHPILTSLHAESLESMPERVVRLALMANERLYHDEIAADVTHHLRYYVFVAREVSGDGSWKRYLESIGRLNEKTGQMEVLYRRKKI